jgi:hypothetical protein
VKRNTLNFIIDVGSALVMAAMVASGLIIRFVLPPGSGSRRQLWGLGRHDWGDVHFWLAAAAGAVVVLHVALHWQWVCVTTLRCLPGGGDRKMPPTPLRRNLTGVAFLSLLVLLFGGFVWLASAGVRDARVGPERGDIVGHDARTAAPGRDAEAARGRGHSDDRSIRGSMTLKEAADACGITVESARARLGLPHDVSGDQRLGQLSAKHGFSMAEVRAKLSAADTDP